MASQRAGNDFFGTSVALSGAYAIVGAVGEDHNATGGAALSNAGAAYLFEGVVEVGIYENHVGTALRCFPNPATETATLQITAPQNLPNTTIEVFNITGAKVYQTTAQFQAGMNNVQLNLANFEKGLYLVQMRNGEAVLQTKLVKR